MKRETVARLDNSAGTYDLPLQRAMPAWNGSAAIGVSRTATARMVRKGREAAMDLTPG